MFGKILKFLGVLFILAVAGFAGLYFWAKTSTSDTQALAGEFITHLSQEELQEAYGLLHNNLKAKVSPSQFAQIVYQGNLQTVTAIDWHSFEVMNGVDKIEGTGVNAQGIPLKATISATEIENEGRLGILSFNFENTN